MANSLSMLPKPGLSRKNGGSGKESVSDSDEQKKKKKRRRLRDEDVMIVVALDGSGNFSSISDAVNFAPNNSVERRTVIYVKEGVYEENVEIPSYKTNIVLLGDGSDVTIITGNRSVGDGWTTFRSATLGNS